MSPHRILNWIRESGKNVEYINAGDNIWHSIELHYAFPNIMAIYTAILETGWQILKKIWRVIIDDEKSICPGVVCS